ncbi:Protein phosphatase 1E [Orchesella cincta]|uniref:Protein phosphatase 1E n=1 Tax=Orchesella cincta TaxID=48709 RepID=A0A1D2N7N9_ORCCI|nr:Protein phosphatase 1E [Orchesella cincta]
MEARTFLENFQVTDIEKDPLPIKVLRNAITKEEINGQAIYWGFEYLDSRSCPLSLIYRILQKLHEEVPVTDFLACAEENHATSLDDTDGAISPDADVRYAPLKLMQAIVKKIDEICLREREDVHDSVDGIIEAPDMLPNVHAVSYNNIKNSRRFMEDRMTVLPRMDRVFSLPAPMSYFAVFDGHNGSEAAAYGAAQLHQYLIKSMSESHDLFDCISNAFEHLDEVFVQKCKAGKIKSGSTAVISLLMADKVYVAWAGDSQAVLVKQNEVNNLVNPHKPERLDEVERIRSLGGEVLNLNGTYRVHGNLAVSRAIGDADEKPFIIATPDIKMQELDGSEEFMILACDGLWDEITPEAAAHIVRRQVVEDASNVSAVSSKLISEAKSRGSTDNITVIVVFFQPLESIKNLYESTITMESGVDNIMSKFENLGFNPAEKLIENVVDGKISPLKEINGHGKDGEPLVDFLSLGSSKESGGQPITDDTDQFGDDDDKDVEQLSDAEPDDEWQFEKPENLGMVSTTLDVQLNNATPEADDVFHSSHISNNQKEFTEPEFEIIQKPLAPVDSVPDVAPEMSDKLSESLNPFMMEAGTVTNGNETELDATFANSTPALSNGGNLFDGENIISETVRTEVDDDDDKPVVLSGTLDVLAEVQQQSPSPDPFGIQESVEQILAPTSAAASEIEEINFGAPSPHFDIQNTFATTQSDAAGDAGANPFELTSNSQSQIDFSDIGYQQVTPQSNVDEIGLGDNNPHISSGVLAEFLVGEQQSSDPFGVRDTFEQLPPQPTAGDIDIAFIAPNFDLHNAASTTEAVLDVNPFAEPPLLGADSQVDFNLGMPPPTNDVVLDDNITGIVTDFLTDQQQQSSQDPFGVQDNLDQSSPLQNATDVDLVLNASNNMDYGNFDLINHAPVKESVPDLATFGDELVSSHSQEKVNGGDEQFNLQEEVPEIIEKSEVIANLEAPIVESAASPQLLSEPERAASSASAVTSPEPEIEDRKSVELSEPVDPVPEIISEVSDKVSESLNPFILETVVNGNGNEHGTDEILGNASPALENNGFLLNGENTQPEIEVDEKPVVVRDLLPDFVADEQKVADRLGGENILQEPFELPQAVVEEIVVAKSATPDLQAAPAIIEAVAEAAPLVETVKINGVEREINNKEKVSQHAAEKSKNVRNVEN